MEIKQKRAKKPELVEWARTTWWRGRCSCCGADTFTSYPPTRGLVDVAGCRYGPPKSKQSESEAP